MTYTLNPTLATTISVELVAVENQSTYDYGTQTTKTSDGNNWSVNLTRENDSLTVSVTWTGNTHAAQQYTQQYNYNRGYGYSNTNQYGSTNHCPYEFIHLVPHKRHGAQGEVTTTAHHFLNRSQVK
ncbi:hypothetical protein BGX26_008454, partial [Mortierella sp. AD094]